MDNMKYLLVRIRAGIVAKRLGVDGGPGSGNFGHSGRPGKVGGSGPGGGGKQYRAYHPTLGYFSSKKDWLNGLSGEKQGKATKFLNAAKKNIPPTSEMKPEEYIMKNWPSEAKEQFVDLVGEARSWKDRGWRLTTDNLSKDENWFLFRLGSELENKFGGSESQFFSDEEFRNNDFDKAIGLMTPEEKEFYLDMKAKACGMPNSGKGVSEYSRAFQSEIGVINKIGVPKTKEENKDWIINVSKDSDEYKELQSIIEGTFGFKQKDISGSYDMNDAEWEMMHKLDMSMRGLSDHSFAEYAKAMETYLERKEEYTDASFFDNLSSLPPVWDRTKMVMGTSNARRMYPMQNALKEWGKESGKELPKDGKELEEGFLSDTEVPDLAKKAYLKLKAGALGFPLGENEAELGIMDLTNYWKGVQTERADKDRKAREAEELKKYNEAKKKNIVVIKGDSMSEGVNRLRKENGDYTNDELKEIGKIVLPEFQKAFDNHDKNLERLISEKDEAYKKFVEEKYKIIDGESMEEKLQRYLPFEAKYDQLLIEYNEEKQKLNDSIIETLSRVRKMGYNDDKALRNHFEGRKSPSMTYVMDALKVYPTDWIEKSIQEGTIITKKEQNRGYYSPGEVHIDGDGKRAKEVATHELGHRFEHIIPGLKEAEKNFYEKRTEGEKAVSLRSLTGNKGYRSDEVTKKDDFRASPYIGKDYGGSWYEVVSMGFQYAYHNPRQMMKDPDFTNFILGILAVG